MAGSEVGEARSSRRRGAGGEGSGSSGGDFRKMVGSHHPLARPHAVPGVRDNTGGSEMPDEILHRRAVTTRARLAWSGASAAGQVERCVLSKRSGMRDSPLLAEHLPTASWW